MSDHDRQQPLLDIIQPFASAGATFAARLDRWLGEDRRRRDPSGERRDDLLLRRALLENLAIAARSPRSIGFYGESQCGKSNLVSRIGEGLGAATTASGSLLIRDPSVDPSRSPWAADGHAGGGIEFAKWLNPVSLNESTGIICRLTSHGPAPIHPGAFVARLLSHADLVASLAYGYSFEIAAHSFDKVDVEHEMAELQGPSSPTERDDSDAPFMGALLNAWYFLREHRPNDERLERLHRAGWDSLVRSLFLDGHRPRWSADGALRSPFVRLAGLLWGQQPQLNDVYCRLLRVSEELAGADEVSIAAVDVCCAFGAGAHPTVARPSILDVAYVGKLLEPQGTGGGVQVHFRARSGSPRIVSMSRAVLASLIRELTLPLQPGAHGFATDIDVLDYPGARNSNPSQEFESQTEAAKATLALEVFRRGKLNKLFLTAVELQDCSSLCLAVTGNGTLSASEVMRSALRAWLGREGWIPGKELARLGRQASGDAPLAMAITKSDTLLNAQGHDLFGKRLKDIEDRYCGDDPWMSDWLPGGERFTRVHWVHNPDLKGVVKPHEQPVEVIAGVKANYMQDEYVLRHVKDPERRFDAVVANPPADVRDLFETLRRTTLAVRRDERIICSVADVLDALADEVRRDYLGRGLPEVVAAERRRAELDVGFLSDALARGRNHVPFILRAVQVTPADVRRACRTAAAEIAADDPGQVGLLSFEDFYRVLASDFAAGLKERLGRPDALAGGRVDPAAAQDTVKSIRSRFAAIPQSAWFRGRIEQEVGVMFSRHNATPLYSNPVLQTVVSTGWNRSMVWLSRQPVARDRDPRVPPGLEKPHAASARIVEHWRQELPAVYAGMVDPSNASQPGNLGLQQMRADLFGAVVAFETALRARLGDGHALVLRASALRAALEDHPSATLESNHAV